MNINSQTIPGTLEDGLNGLFGIEYRNIETQFTKIYTTLRSSRQFEEHQGLSGFDNPSVKPEGTNTRFLSTGQTYRARYVHQTISAAFAITKEAASDGRYGSQSARYVRALALSFMQVKEWFAAAVLNQAYSTDAPSGDGKPILATNHPSRQGPWSNILGNAGMELNDETLEALLVLIPSIQSDSGQYAGLRADTLIVPDALELQAERVLRSMLRSGTMDNDINAIRTLNKVPGGVVTNTWLTNPDQWFVKTNSPDGLTHYQRWDIENMMEGDFLSNNMRYKSEERYSFGITDNRGLVAPPQ